MLCVAADIRDDACDGQAFLRLVGNYLRAPQSSLSVKQTGLQAVKDVLQSVRDQRPLVPVGAVESRS